jgi:hypothetical protein
MTKPMKKMKNDSNNAGSSSNDEDELVNSGEKFEIVFDKILIEPPLIIK